MSEISKGQLENGKQIQKEYSPKEVRDVVLKISRMNGGLDYMLETFGSDILSKLSYGSEKEKEKAREAMGEKSFEIMRVLEVDTQVALRESFNDEYRGFAKEFNTQLIKEYRCETHLEKALAEIVTNAYIRILDNSRRLNNDLGKPGQTINENRTKYLAMLSIQTDRANRQFLNALVTLKQIKTPTLEMNIKANTAFIAGNQQINAGNPPKSTKNETNEPK